jgi:transposase
MTMTVLDHVPVTGDARRVTGERQERPDPEVPERARRRTFTAAYKQEILAAYDAAGPGEKGAMLRREGLCSSLITEWRRARDAGALAGLKQPRGRPAADPRDAQIARLRKEKAKLEQELAKARFVVNVQAKLRGALGDDLPGRGTPPTGRIRDRPGDPGRSVASSSTSTPRTAESGARRSRWTLSAFSALERCSTSSLPSTCRSAIPAS